MSLQQKSMLPVGVLCLLAAVYLVLRALFAQPDPSIAISKHSVNKKPQETLKYWTKGKMRKAKPAQMPNVKVLDQEQRPPV